MISLLITVLIVCIVVALLIWIVRILPIPAPFGLIAQAVIGVIALIWVLELLLGSGGLSLGAR
jgi:hypothetical protein